MGKSNNLNTKITKCQKKFASKPQKSTWPLTSSWTPECRLSQSLNWSMFPSKVVASAHERPTRLTKIRLEISAVHFRNEIYSCLNNIYNKFQAIGKKKKKKKKS